ncbi:MAG TPA: hypothetical protein PK559_14420 [Ignavibacteriaceae bacterium]|nr:hypothetical protein [Ignavibacteriaceae bacterium]
MSLNLLTKLLALLLLPLLFSAVSCNKPTEPNENTPPGRRDYVWSVDTLYSPNNILREIWGATPTDIWLAGPGGITNYDGLWHFDGTQWKPYEKQILGLSPNCIFGLSQNNIWLGGNDGKIWHFNGTSWNQSFRYQTGSSYVDVVSISGKTENSIYAVGNSAITHGFILHYNGSNWVEKYSSTEESQFVSLLQGDNGTFLAELKQSVNGNDSLKIYEFKTDKLIELFSKPVNEITFASINKIGKEVYFLLGRELNRYENGKFIKVMTFTEPKLGYHVYGRNEKDFFVRMVDGLAHFNGENVEYLIRFENDFTSISTKPLIFEKEVFFPVSDYINGYNLVFHGKLKD